MYGTEEELRERALARVGMVLRGKYRLERVLGIGGMATVYAAAHRNGRRVALKLLHPELSTSADLRDRFVREGQAANAVNHPGAVIVIDDDVAEDGSAFVVMELLEGQSIEELWVQQNERLPQKLVLAIARELCEVLVAAHGAGIVHRDIKPENLFLTREGRLKVLDFGIARVRDALAPKMTHTGMVFGTPAFMSPEQASGRISQVDSQADLWAVGATMFTLLTGKIVHEGETAQHILVLAATTPARSLASVLPHADRPLVDLVDRALELDKGRRFQTAAELHAAICTVSLRLVGESRPELEGFGDVTSVQAPRESWEAGTEIMKSAAASETTLTDLDATAKPGGPPKPSSSASASRVDEDGDVLTDPLADFITPRTPGIAAHGEINGPPDSEPENVTAIVTPKAPAVAPGIGPSDTTPVLPAMPRPPSRRPFVVEHAHAEGPPSHRMAKGSIKLPIHIEGEAMRTSRNVHENILPDLLKELSRREAGAGASVGPTLGATTVLLPDRQRSRGRAKTTRTRALLLPIATIVIFIVSAGIAALLIYPTLGTQRGAAAEAVAENPTPPRPIPTEPGASSQTGTTAAMTTGMAATATTAVEATDGGAVAKTSAQVDGGAARPRTTGTAPPLPTPSYDPVLDLRK